MIPQTINVLLIEDNVEHVALLRQLLALSAVSAEYHLIHAESLTKGLDQLKAIDIELVLLDLSLSDSDGLETFLRVLEAAPKAAIVVLSGTDDIALATETVQLGAQDYLVKGHVDNHLLVRAMHYSIERKRAQLLLSKAYDELEVRVQERTAMLQTANTRLQKEIADRRRAEQETLDSNRQLAAALAQLRATQQQIIQRERMHALGRMSNGIAHDFNNALAPILGFSELLLMKPEIMADPERLRNYVEMINTAAQESAQVVSRLREFYRHKEEGEIFVPIVVNELVQQVISVTQPRWKDQALAAGVNITMRTELSSVPTLAGNELELREALANIVFNAIDAITSRGTITLKTEQQGRWVTINVTDDGAGMTDAVKARCLEPFYSTKEDQSTGLGLGSVYGIVRRHEGEIDVQSELGRGTSVTISLPIERGKKPPPVAKAPAPPSAALRILVVDDEPLVREVMSVYLAEDQHEVTTAVNGRDGLERFRAGEFDLIMTDRAMPEMNGDQFAKAVKELKADQPIILLTGFGDLMTGAGEKPDGVDLVVSKPFTLNILREAIARAMGR